MKTDRNYCILENIRDRVDEVLVFSRTNESVAKMNSLGQSVTSHNSDKQSLETKVIKVKKASLSIVLLMFC